MSTDSTSLERIRLLNPVQLWTRSELLTRPCPIPRSSGVYAWYFRNLLPSSETATCHQHQGFALLYVGIAPSSPPQNSKPASTQTLRKRIQYHLRGNAEGSSLRLSLGCLLASSLGLELRRVGSGTRMTFDPREQILSAWMEDNARVAWLEHPEPWVLESHLIRSLSLPLNLDQNEAHPFHPKLTALRAEARSRARALPIISC